MRHAYLDLASPEDTSSVAAKLGETLKPAETILLEGSVGAGKTHFARSLIQHILLEPEDVPSPTFTLVQIYDTLRGPLWHADLYRVCATHELEELGLTDAFDTAICLVEWPDVLGDLAPENALTLRFAPGEDPNARRLVARWTDEKWTARLDGWAR